MTVALLHFLKGLPPFLHAAVRANGGLGNLREKIQRFKQGGSPDIQLPAGVNVVAESLAPQKLVVGIAVGNVGKHAGPVPSGA